MCELKMSPVRDTNAPAPAVGGGHRHYTEGHAAVRIYLTGNNLFVPHDVGKMMQLWDKK